MANAIEAYRDKLRTPAEAVALIPDGSLIE